jgi:hypothetical protein
MEEEPEGVDGGLHGSWWLASYDPLSHLKSVLVSAGTSSGDRKSLNEKANNIPLIGAAGVGEGEGWRPRSRKESTRRSRIGSLWC